MTTTTPTFKCCGTRCPGLPFPASLSHPHPMSHIGHDQPVSEQTERWQGMAPQLPNAIPYLSPVSLAVYESEVQESYRVWMYVNGEAVAVQTKGPFYISPVFDDPRNV